ncbi:hypothetical protein FZEAL_7518 [Fusarium zealandicum]|uniref:Secreted protein n=1 Tax=Fusarium zealandicum TaxID=1053134 RepID=A0A8H4XIS7_9HYPO|nr:hypothetical protein FZEAL_7518 [Fusarium zealandicum]
MFNKITTVLGLLSVPIAADFKVYLGSDQSLSEGGNQLVWAMMLFNNPPSCKDADRQPSMLNNPHNDATMGGWACDGCDETNHLLDWPIDRLELPHRMKYSEEVDGPLSKQAPFKSTGCHILRPGGIMVFDSSNRHFYLAIYWTDATNSYELRDESTVWGRCDRWKKEDKPQHVECYVLFRYIEYDHYFTCYTDLTLARGIKDGEN